jgi:tRNA-splicing ligase RtcB
MIKIITTEKTPIKMWVEEMEDAAIQQARNLANLPFIYKHLALMPDAHSGFGMPIGGVFASVDVIIPNAVGVDIGCGMCAVKTTLTNISKSQLQEIVNLIKQGIPVGIEHHKEPQNEILMPVGFNLKDLHVVKNEYISALRQIGTLGGGNHFIEIQKGNDGHIWIMIHSGSRNLGKKVADYYNKEAVKLNCLWHSQIDKTLELSFLPIQSKEAKEYFKEMNFCIEFAFANRRLMLDRIKSYFIDVIGDDIGFDPIINIAHNYARWESHFGKDVIVHRKGATSARFGEIGIIPGSQGSKSFIVQGLGNRDSFMSCSHGAGRKMGRNQAIRTLDLQKEIDLMNRQGIIHELKTVQNLDEAPGAYKDIDTVMNNQRDLVKILVELRPLAVVKG